MALSRALLRGMGLTDEQVQVIIDAHRETVDGLKEEIEKQKTEAEKFREDAEKLADVQKELDGLKKDGGDWQKKFDDEHKAFEDYKKDIEQKETVAKIKEAYKALLKNSNVNEKHLDAVLRVTDISALKLKDDGTLENADKLTESIKKDWSDFITEDKKKGADVETPPGNDGKEKRKPGRAGEIARQYHEGMYGAVEEKKE